MRQKRLLSLGVLAGVLLAASSALGQQPDPILDPLQKRVGLFFEQVKSKNTASSFQELLGSKTPGTPEERKKLEEQTALIESAYGTYRGFECVYTRQVGRDLVFLKYLYKCSRLPVLWHLTFYRSSSGSELSPQSQTWQVVSIRFDTDLEVLTLLKP